MEKSGEQLEDRSVGALSIVGFQKEVHQVSKSHGWYDRPRSDLEDLMLIVTEVAEVVEELRKPEVDPAKVAEETADIFIRLLDFAEKNGMDLEEAVLRKHLKNKSRPYRHGNKRY